MVPKLSISGKIWKNWKIWRTLNWPCLGRYRSRAMALYDIGAGRFDNRRGHSCHKEST